METIKEIPTKTINGVELPHYANEHWWSDGLGNYKSRIDYDPMYSSQCNPKHIGEEPRYSDFSVHTPQTYTHYYSVSKAEYDAMKVKPDLKRVCRPGRYHNFDGFTECIQKEKSGLGWEEIDVVTYHTKFRKIFFVED